MFARHHLSAPTIVNEQLDCWSRSKCHHCGHGNGRVKKCHFVIKIVAEDQNSMQKHAGGHKRIITPQDDRYASLAGKRNRNTTPSLIDADIANAAGIHTSARNISLRLNQVCSYTRKPV